MAKSSSYNWNKNPISNVNISIILSDIFQYISILCKLVSENIIFLQWQIRFYIVRK